MGMIGDAIRSVVDVGKEVIPKLWTELTNRSIIAKEITALENYAKRVANKFVNQDEADSTTKRDNPAAKYLQVNKTGSKVQTLGDIMKNESGKLGREMLMGLIPLAPTVSRETQQQSTYKKGDKQQDEN